MNQLGITRRAQIIRCLVEGCSIRSTVRMTGASKNTVTKLLVELGASCSEYQDKNFRNLTCKRFQADEIWSFVGCKQKYLTGGRAESATFGDVWTWTAIDADTKLIPCWLVGKRDAGCAKEFIQDLASRLANRVHLTTDGLKVYLNAIIDALADDIDYSILHKIYGTDRPDSAQYSPAVCIGCETQAILGNLDEKHVSTCYVERANLSTRMGTRRFTPLTNAFSKKIENHAASIAVYFMWYNFGRKHQMLGTSPAVQAGVANHVWTVEEIIGLPDESVSDHEET